MFASTASCQKELHAWGRANQVAFDAGKESHHVVSHVSPEGPDFKILGILFDCGLTMAAAIHELAGECRWKIRGLLRLARYHTQNEMVQLYKSQVLSFIEYRTPGIYHACDSHLQVLDRLQESFLRDISVDTMDALLQYNLAPLSTRRDIAMLGLIHRTVLGKGPPQFSRFFFLEPLPVRRVSTRSRSRAHFRRIHEHLKGRYLDKVKRSCLGLASVYNILPPEVVAPNCVSSFQCCLQDLVKSQVLRSGEWSQLLSPRHWLHAHPLLHV